MQLLGNYLERCNDANGDGSEMIMLMTREARRAATWEIDLICDWHEIENTRTSSLAPPSKKSTNHHTPTSTSTRTNKNIKTQQKENPSSKKDTSSTRRLQFDSSSNRTADSSSSFILVMGATFGTTGGNGVSPSRTSRRRRRRPRHSTTRCQVDWDEEPTTTTTTTEEDDFEHSLWMSIDLEDVSIGESSSSSSKEEEDDDEECCDYDLPDSSTSRSSIWSPRSLMPFNMLHHHPRNQTPPHLHPQQQGTEQQKEEEDEETVDTEEDTTSQGSSSSSSCSIQATLLPMENPTRIMEMEEMKSSSTTQHNQNPWSVRFVAPLTSTTTTTILPTTSNRCDETTTVDRGSGTRRTSSNKNTEKEVGNINFEDLVKLGSSRNELEGTPQHQHQQQQQPENDGNTNASQQTKPPLGVGGQLGRLGISLLFQKVVAEEEEAQLDMMKDSSSDTTSDDDTSDCSELEKSQQRHQPSPENDDTTEPTKQPLGGGPLLGRLGGLLFDKSREQEEHLDLLNGSHCETTNDETSDCNDLEKVQRQLLQPENDDIAEPTEALGGGPLLGRLGGLLFNKNAKEEQLDQLNESATDKDFSDCNACETILEQQQQQPESDDAIEPTKPLGGWQFGRFGGLLFSKPKEGEGEEELDLADSHSETSNDASSDCIKLEKLEQQQPENDDATQQIKPLEGGQLVRLSSILFYKSKEEQIVLNDSHCDTTDDKESDCIELQNLQEQRQQQPENEDTAHETKPLGSGQLSRLSSLFQQQPEHGGTPQQTKQPEHDDTLQQWKSLGGAQLNRLGSLLFNKSRDELRTNDSLCETTNDEVLDSNEVEMPEEQHQQEPENDDTSQQTKPLGSGQLDLLDSLLFNKENSHCEAINDETFNCKEEKPQQQPENDNTPQETKPLGGGQLGRVSSLLFNKTEEERDPYDTYRDEKPDCTSQRITTSGGGHLGRLSSILLVKLKDSPHQAKKVETDSDTESDTSSEYDSVQEESSHREEERNNQLFHGLWHNLGGEEAIETGLSRFGVVFTQQAEDQREDTGSATSFQNYCGTIVRPTPNDFDVFEPAI
eukprot:scaffold4791_cov144-Cylindrotheca_fusiformis.AAC.1